MIRYYITLILIVAGGFAVKNLITPSNDEMALIYLKAGHYSDAQKYMDRIHQESDPTIKNLLPLLELRIRFGGIKEAIDLLEKLVANNPKLLEARELLVLYYRLAQRPIDELQTQEEIRKLKPTQKLLETLVARYDLLAMYPEEIDVLYQLIHEYPKKPEYFIQLTKLLASRKQWIDAADVIMALHRRHPKSMSPDLALLHADMLLMVGNRQKALAETKSWLKSNFDPSYASVFGDLFHYGADAETAWELLEPYQGAALHSTDLLIKWVELADATGRSAQVLPILEKHYKQGKLTLKILPQLAEMAMKSQQMELAMQVVATLPDSGFPAWLKHSLVDHVLDKKNVEHAGSLTTILDVEFMNKNPIKVASLAWLQGNKVDTGFWLDRAWSGAAINGDHLQQGMALLLEMGEKKQAMSWARRAVSDPNAPSWLLADLRQFFLEEKRFVEGFALFSRLKLQREDFEVDKGWLLFSTIAGKNQNGVIVWLEQQQQNLGNFLAELAYVAIDHGNYPVALVAAKKLDEREQNRDSRRLLLETMLAVGHLEQAMEMAAKIAGSEDSEDLKLYGQIVRKVWEEGKPVAATLKELARNSLHNPPRYGLAADHVELGYLALDLGERDLAEQSFMLAAKDAGPKSPIVGQLSYLWGPQAPKKAIAWLLKRSNAAPPEQLAGWMEHLLNAGEPQLVVEVAGSRPKLLGRDYRFADLLQEALLRLDKKQMVAELMLHQLRLAPQKPKRLRAMGRAARDLDLKSTAAIIMKALLQHEQNDPEALRYLGGMALADRRWQEAEGYFQRLIVQPKANHQDYINLGDALMGNGADERGKLYLQEALAQLELSSSYAERSTKARLLHRLGMQERALFYYAQLLAEKKDDHWLRADYVELLFDMKRLDLAQRVLGETSIQ